MKPIRVTTKATDMLWETANDNFASEERKLAAIAVLHSVRAEDRGAIDAALKAVNGRAESFAITGAATVERVAREAEKRLELVTRRNRVGTEVVYRPSGPRAKAYTYAAQSTQITLRRVSDGWRLVDVQESRVYPKRAEVFAITISAAARDDITRNALAGMHVREDEEAMAA